jgi:hypothetical protein
MSDPQEVLGNICMRNADSVNHPGHYNQGGIECIDAIVAALGHDGAIAFCQGQVLRYAWRVGRKGPAAEDFRKAEWYARRAAELLEGK